MYVDGIDRAFVLWRDEPQYACYLHLVTGEQPVCEVAFHPDVEVLRLLPPHQRLKRLLHLHLLHVREPCLVEDKPKIAPPALGALGRLVQLSEQLSPLVDGDFPSVVHAFEDRNLYLRPHVGDLGYHSLNRDELVYVAGIYVALHVLMTMKGCILFNVQ